jgi:hypothetical protein
MKQDECVRPLSLGPHGHVPNEGVTLITCDLKRIVTQKIKYINY